MIGGTGSLEVVGFHRNMIQTMKVIGRLFVFNSTGMFNCGGDWSFPTTQLCSGTVWLFWCFCHPSVRQIGQKCTVDFLSCIMLLHPRRLSCEWSWPSCTWTGAVWLIMALLGCFCRSCNEWRRNDDGSVSRLNYLDLCHGLINHSVWGQFLLWKQHEEV